MFNNIFKKNDPVADMIAQIAEADYKAKMEELKGQQHKIDKNKNNKIDAHDFAILRGEKKAMKKEEVDSVEEANNPFDVKNYKSQLKSKPGEKAGFDSKKTSTGTVYSRKPVKDEPMKKEEIDPNKTTVDTLNGREKDSKNPFLSKKVFMDVPDNVKEETEQIDELKKTTVKSYLKKKVDTLPGKDPKKDQESMMRAHHRVTGVKPTSEEVEKIDERELTKGETAEKERIVKGMKKSFAGFKQRYGDKAKSVMYATATKAAKKD
jgi:hypothetical protein